jgi:hypothetical protein
MVQAFSRLGLKPKLLLRLNFRGGGGGGGGGE